GAAEECELNCCAVRRFSPNLPWSGPLLAPPGVGNPTVVHLVFNRVIRNLCSRGAIREKDQAVGRIDKAANTTAVRLRMIESNIGIGSQHRENSCAIPLNTVSTA